MRIALASVVVLAPAGLLSARHLRPPPDPLPQARLLLAGGDPTAAADLARRAVARRPRDAVAWHLLGECLRLGGRRAEADEAMRHAVALAPEWDAPVVSLAARALARERMHEAATFVDTAFARGASSAALFRLRARLRRRRADFAGAASDLTAAARCRGGRARDLLEAAVLRRAESFVTGIPSPERERLLDVAERRARAEPRPDGVLRAIATERGDVSPDPGPDDDPDHALRRALALDRAGRTPAAVDALGRLVAASSARELRHMGTSLPPQDRTRLAALIASASGERGRRIDAHESTAHAQAARVAHATGSAALVTAHLRERLLRAPNDPDAALALGLRLGEQRRPDAALRIAERLPGGTLGPAGRRLLGWFHVGSGAPERADVYLLRPGSEPQSDAGRAGFLAATGARDPRTVAEDARAALRHTPRDPVPHLLLGLVAGHEGDHRTACVHLAAALARDPSLSVAANDLAWWLATRGDAPQRALPLALWAGHLAPRDAHVRHTLTVVRERLRGAATAPSPTFSSSSTDERTSR